MLISIVITAYNVEKYISLAIESVLDQTYKDIECIVVLDCPTDGTEKIVNVYSTDVKIIKNKLNIGAGASRKAGIEHAHGEYILLLDGDDYISPDFIESLAKCAQETDADIVSGGITVMNEDGSWTATSYGNNHTEGLDKITKFWGEKIVFMNNKLIRKTMYDYVPYCTRRYIEDTPVIIPQLWYANKVEYVDNVGYTYRMQPESLTHTASPIKDLIFKGLCWCELMEFFIEKEPKLFEVFPLQGFVSNTLELLNTMTISQSDIEPYKEEWCEFTRRLFSLIKVNNIDFK